MLLSGNVGAHRSDFLDLEYSASLAYNLFVYRDRPQADAVRQLLFDKGVAEFSPRFSSVLLRDGAVVGMLSCLGQEDLTKCRMKSALALARSGAFEQDPELKARISAAGQTLMELAPGDFYLSRIAVPAASGGSGYGSELMRACLASAARAGATRVALEVSADNAAAAALYVKHGFHEVDRQIGRAHV